MEDEAISLPSGIVTFVFTDIEGSTRLLRRLGDRYPGVLDRHREVLRSAWQSHGGVEVETEGDGVLAAFADAGAAILACAAAQCVLLGEDWPTDGFVRVRMGVHSGLAYPRGDAYVAMAVHQAARVVAAAHGSQVLVSEQTAEIAANIDGIALESLGRFRLRDFDESVQLFQVSADGLPTQFHAVRALPAEGHNLVRPPTSFIGRDEALAAVLALLGPGRLVSLVGPGGVGKTRLVTELGLHIAPAWRDGVWFIDLSPLQDVALIPATVAAAVGCSVAAAAEPWQAVLDHLRQRQALLIFDNCEHVIDAVARRVADLLRECAEVGMLATSREPLGLTGEQVWRLAPLATTGDAITPAAQLFAARARAVQPTFELDAISTPIVTAICNRLDGLPLAIELAAARIGVLSPKEILAGLEDRFRLLRNRDRTVPDRQRTLEALLDWSYQLLTVTEQAALRRLGVFAGSFDLETATAAVADAEFDAYDVPERVWSLAEKSLISVEPVANATRYRLFDSIRAYAQRRLDEAGETNAIVIRLADWYLERVGPWLPGSHAATNLMATEIDNLRRLTALLARSDQPRAQSIAGAMGHFHHFHGSAGTGIVETQGYLEQIPEHCTERVTLLCALANLLVDSGQYAAATQVANEAATLRQDVGVPPWDAAITEQALAVAASASGDYTRAFQIAKQALSGALSDRSRSRMTTQLAIAAAGLGDLDSALAAASESYAIVVRSQRDEAVGSTLSTLAEVEFRMGRWQDAAAHQRAALATASQSGSLVVIAFSMILAARLNSRQSEWPTVARLHAKAEAILAQLGHTMYEDDRRISGVVLAAARDALGDAQYEAERRIGEQLSLPEAIQLTDTVLRSVASISADP